MPLMVVNVEGGGPFKYRLKSCIFVSQTMYSVNEQLQNENQSLLLQLQQLLNQNSDLLTQVLNSKDHFAEESKQYL
jgi:hypothetical protein